MSLGLIKWFDNSKGFGVLQTPELGEIFVHKNNFIIKPDNISQFQAIFFEEETDEKGRKVARKCRFVGESGDWKLIMSSFDEADDINLKIEVKRNSTYVNPFWRKETKTLSVRKYAAKQLIETKTKDEIVSMLTHYVDNDLNQELLFSYCKFIEDVASLVVGLDMIDRRRKRNYDFDEVFIYFRNIVNPETLFRIWKNRHLEYLGYWVDGTSVGSEYEIPESILSMFSDELDINELLRIKGFSFGAEFCQEFVNKKFLDLEHLSIQELHKYYKYLDLMTEEKKTTYKYKLDQLSSEHQILSLIQETAKSGPITIEQNRNKCNRFKGIWPKTSREELHRKIEATLHRIITNKSIELYNVELYKVELWIQGFMDQVPLDFVFELFLSPKISDPLRCIILSKLEISKRIELLKLFVRTHDWKHTFYLIYSYEEYEEYLDHFTELRKIKAEIIQNSPNEILNDISLLKKFLSSTSITVELSANLKEKLIAVKDKIRGSSLIFNFDYLKMHKIIENENHLLNLLLEKKLDFHSLIKLGSLISDSEDIPTLRDIIKNNSIIFSTEDKINVLKAFAQEKEFVEILINEYKNSEWTDFPSDLLDILDFARQSKIKQQVEERQSKIKDEEFKALVAEIKPKCFTMSWQVSNYIVSRRLGDKYKHISGVLEMENGGSSWKFDGGFPPDIYAKLCQELGLRNKGTHSRVVGFTSYNEM